MPQSLLFKQARAIAEPLKGKLGFDPVTIITLLIPLLSRLPCFRQEEQTPAEFAASHYDEDSDTFDSHVIARMRPKARKAAKKDGQRKCTPEQLDMISEATLRRALTEDDDTASELLASLPPE